MPTPLIRTARPDDLAAIVSFQLAMALETEDRKLDRALVERGVARALADPGRGTYRVAELDGHVGVVGSLLITREWSDWRDGWFWWIQSVYVTPAARGLGVYGALHSSVERDARADPEVCGVRLYVEVENVRARRTYERLGMSETSYRLYEVEL